jgi:hypothetical protein
MQIPDFNTLIATSQEHQTPVFALENNMFGVARTRQVSTPQS